MSSCFKLLHLPTPNLYSWKAKTAVTCNLKNMMKDAVMDSWFFDEPSDRSTFGRLQGKKVDDMVNTNL
jgi:hypothetical protein